MKSPACAGLFFVLRGLPGSGCSAFRPGMLWHLAPRTSHLAHGSPSASRARLAPSLCTLGRLAGRPWCPPSLLRQVLRVRQGKAAARPVYLFGLRPLHLCGTRLEGGHQGLSRRYGQLEGEPLAWCRRRRQPSPEPQGDAEATAGTRRRVPGCRPPSSRLRVRWCSCVPAFVRADDVYRALARPTRTSGSGRVFGAHPRGEFRTSGAAVGQIGTWAASAAFLIERGGPV